jgi:hypothetical protein
MNSLSPLLLAALAALAGGCNRSAAAAGSVAAPAAEFKNGFGLQLSAEAQQRVGLALAEVETRAFPHGAVAAVPADALLRTVRGDFVFVQNGDWLLRTPVTVGATHGGWIEIAEGLYEGDRLAVRGIRALWLAELQAVNGGVGCADGH